MVRALSCGKFVPNAGWDLEKLSNLVVWHAEHWPSSIGVIDAPTPLCSVWQPVHDAVGAFVRFGNFVLWAANAIGDWALGSELACFSPKLWHETQDSEIVVRSNIAPAQPVNVSEWPTWHEIQPSLAVNCSCLPESGPGLTELGQPT